MNRGSNTNSQGGNNRTAFFIGFLLVTGAIVGLSYWVIGFVVQTARPDDEQPLPANAPSLLYVNYNVNVDDYVTEESYLAMGQYLYDNEETINVQVLGSASPQEIVGYMLNYFSAGLQVNCTYCHSLDNFAADVWDDPVAMENKNTARLHALVAQDLNQNWLGTLTDITQDRQPSGSQIICATCHNGVAVPQTWADARLGVLPEDFRLTQAIAEDQNLAIDFDTNLLNVNARSDISLDTVQYNQQVMYHMNSSMNVGCTHCHNSRYFPSNEVPNKLYAQHMLGMTQVLWTDYNETMNGSEPSCTLCHQGQIVPPGAARGWEVMPVDIRYEPAD